MSGVYEWLSKFFGRLPESKATLTMDPFELAAQQPQRRPQKRAMPVATEEEAPSAGVRHDPALIPRLKDDHRALLKQYAAIKTAAQDNNWTAVHAGLQRFRAELTDHLLTESVKLYVYLRIKLSADASQLRLMRSFSSEMVGIGKAVVDFIESYEDVALDSHKQAQFMTGWGEIGKVLGDRIGREEKTLYPMYDEPLIDRYEQMH